MKELVSIRDHLKSFDYFVFYDFKQMRFNSTHTIPYQCPVCFSSLSNCPCSVDSPLVNKRPKKARPPSVSEILGIDDDVELDSDPYF